MQLAAKQAHRRLGLFIGIFLTVHFAAHFSALSGIAAQDAVLRWGRAIYRIPLIETALVAALGTQVVLGVALLRQIARRKRRGLWHWVQFASGCYLAYFIVMHTAAALISRLALGLDTNFYWAAGSLVVDPLRYGFAPYYTLAVTALVGHLLAALHFRSPRRWHAPALIVGPLAGIAIVMAYGGGFYPIELPQAHINYFNLYPGVDE
jgi:hypothetical protein